MLELYWKRSFDVRMIKRGTSHKRPPADYLLGIVCPRNNLGSVHRMKVTTVKWSAHLEKAVVSSQKSVLFNVLSTEVQPYVCLALHDLFDINMNKSPGLYISWNSQCSYNWVLLL